ncbi:hypothetical protein HAX54_010611, partial [Datura stramonium]|nr:hypothetical protein [Datura stramonium]
ERDLRENMQLEDENHGRDLNGGLIESIADERLVPPAKNDIQVDEQEKINEVNDRGKTYDMEEWKTQQTGDNSMNDVGLFTK